MSLLAPTYRPAPTARAAATAPRGIAPSAAAPHASPYASQGSRYRDAELLSATPGQLVVMLYDKILLTLRRARIACESGQIAARCEHIVKTIDMVTELRVSLDHAQGGAISTQLDALYDFMLRELLEANRRQDIAKIDVVSGIATELRDAFAQIVASGAGAVPAARSA